MMRATGRFLPNRIRSSVGAALLCLLVASAPARAQGVPVAVDVGSRALAPAVPGDFLGLSYEVRDIAQIVSVAARGNLVGFLRSLGTGVLRLGGVTADTRSAWAIDEASRPVWATAVVRPQDLDAIAQLSRLSGWRVLLTVNFGHFDPLLAQLETSYAALALGENLAGVAFGNEPDALALYGLRPRPWTFEQYRPQADAYRAAIAAATPSVPIAGPDQASGHSGLAWLAGEAAFERPALLTAHYYPLAWCVGYHPTLADLVSRAIHGAEARNLGRLAAVSRRNRLPLRIDETNDISCGGEPGVSNAFSSALWATDFLARTMTLGFAGINFHGHLANFTGYAPLAAASPEQLRAGRLTAQPEWYALLLAKHLLGDRPLAAALRPAGLNLTSYAFASPRGGRHVVLVNGRPAGSAPLRIAVHVGAGYGSGHALALTAATLGATTGVTLGGATVLPGGGWSTARRRAAVPVAGGVASVTLAPGSAVLVSLPRVAHR